MKTWTTHSGTRVVELLHGRCNCFLVERDATRLLVDTGVTRAWPKLKNRLVEAGVRPREPLALLLTHTHFDHVSNAARIVAEYGAKVLVHEAEANFLGGGDTPLPAGTVPPTRALLRVAGSLARKRARYEPVQADIRLSGDHDLRPLGVDATIIHTPGHSAGSVSVIVGSEIALVGDAMFGIFPGAVFPPFADNTDQLVASWRKLLDTGCRAFLPAHGRPQTREMLERGLAKRHPVGAGTNGPA